MALLAATMVGVAIPGSTASGTESGGHQSAGPAAPASSGVASRRETHLVLPRGELFEPLVADGRWPRFSGEYQLRLGTDEFDRLAVVSFGESFSLVRSPQYDWGEWEFGIQAMVDAIFDMDKKSSDLSNEDYLIGLTGSVRSDGVTTQFRVYHISSHVGDEYLIANGLTRKSVSFEVIDLLASYEPRDWMRVYGGGGVLINPHPAYDLIVTQFGVELTSPLTFSSRRVTPIFGTDLQLRQENDWIPEVAVLCGLRLANPEDDVRRIEVFARFYHGRSPDGQFFDQTIDSLGLGVRLGF